MEYQIHFDKISIEDPGDGADYELGWWEINGGFNFCDKEDAKVLLHGIGEVFSKFVGHGIYVVAENKDDKEDLCVFINKDK
jgi:hypothetical protein